MKELTLAMRMLRRDWSSGELRVLALAIVVAVASITAVGFFTDRIGQLLALQANELLGGDLAVSSPAPFDGALRQRGEGAGLQVTQTIAFPSMASRGERFELASIKAVERGYPLRGDIRIAPSMFAPDAPAKAVPDSGSVWLESRLMTALGVQVGDRVQLGDASFHVTAVITSEPARAGGSLFNIAPRAMINASDLPATRLISPASRVSYQLLFAGEASQVHAFRKQLERTLAPGQRLQGIEDARPEVRTALERAQRFLGLAALVSVMLAGVAVAMATRRFVLRHLDSCAILRCLGAAQNAVVRVFTAQLVVLGLAAAVLGTMLGFLAQFALVQILGSLAQVQLPPPSLRPAAFGVLVGMITLLAFALPPLLRLRDVSTLRVLRREMGSLPLRSAGLYGAGVLVLAGLIYWQSADPRLGTYILLGTVATVAVLALVAAALVYSLRGLRGRVGVAWRFGVANITRRASTSVVQVVAFGLGLMALLLLTLVRTDLLADWRDRLPPDAPNRFLINIQPDQAQGVRDYLARSLDHAPQVFPMVRGRFVGHDDRAVVPEDYMDDRAQRLAAREFNLSWAGDLQSDNRIVAGRGWSDAPPSQPVWSVEAGLAETLGIELGDVLTFNVAGRTVSGEVTSLREVDWDSFRVNFFVLAPPGVLDDFPATYITAFYLPEDRHEVLVDLLRQFPNITVIDVAAIMTQVRSIIERVILAVEYVFLFTLLAGAMVLYAAIQSTFDERLRETAILRTLGGRRRQLVAGVLAEFAGLGLLAGLVAAVAASAVGYVLAVHTFNLDYQFNPWIWLGGMGAGAVGVGLAGTLGTLGVLRRPPLQTLRNA